MPPVSRRPEVEGDLPALMGNFLEFVGHCQPS
jgi:hypothetical protein